VSGGALLLSGEAGVGKTVLLAAGRMRPSWYLVATDDRMIPPAAQRAMSERAGSTVAEVAASHAVYVSQPAAVADLIKRAATATGR
jgi:pimeloyl-ACP methyl ester carboxylesterase